MPKALPAPPPPGATPDNPQALPPPGDERREELRRRRDDLERQAAKLNEELEGGVIDQKALEPINEILGIYDIAMLVDGRLSGYEYCWVHAPQEKQFHSPHVTIKKTLGWEVVQGDMPECRDKRIMGKDGTTVRSFGDCILMRITKDKYDELWRLDAEKRRKIEKGVDEALMDMGERYKGAGITVTRDYDETQVRGDAARQIAGQKLDDMLRKGTMPGMRMRSG